MSEDRDTLQRLHFRYLFSFTLLGNEQFELYDEERKFYAYMSKYSSYLFTLHETAEIHDFVQYTEDLMKAVNNKYLDVFKDKNIFKSDEIKDIIELIIDSSLSTEFVELQRVLGSYISTPKKVLNYLKCVLICSSLLFLIRTTKRVMFMYISQRHNKPLNNNPNISKPITVQPIKVFKNLSTVIEYIAKFIQDVDKPIDDFENQRRKLLIDQKVNNDNIAKKNIEITQLQQKLNLSEDQKNKKIQENDVLKNELIEKQKQIDDFNNEAIICRLGDILEGKTKRSKQDLLGIVSISKKFNKLFRKWDKTETNTHIIQQKMKYLAGLNKDIYIDALKVLEGIKQSSNEEYTDNLVDYNDISIIQLTGKIESFEYVGIFTSTLLDKIDMFYMNGPLYEDLIDLYEEVTGAVRVIVRVRDVYEERTQQAGMKRKINNKLNVSHKRRRLHGGSYETINLDNYEIKLDSNGKRVIFEGDITSSGIFKNYELDNGPFYAIEGNSRIYKNTSKSNTTTNSQGHTVEQRMLNAIGFFNLIKTFENSKSNTNPPAIILYTYGYSGSGKSYTLFGEKKQDYKDLPEKGVLWEIIRQLTSDKYNYDVKLLSRNVCYGYLDFDQVNHGYTFITEQSEKTSDEVLKTNPKTWANIINSDFTIASSQKDIESNFIKSTPNNKESSRGFYILKVGVYSKRTDTLKGYIGIVDMAGNEDPYDIAATLCPTMNYTNMDVLLAQPNEVQVYDYLYKEIQDCLVDISKSTIIPFLYKKYGTVPIDINKDSSILGIHFDEKTQPRLFAIQKRIKALADNLLETAMASRPDTAKEHNSILTLIKPKPTDKYKEYTLVFNKLGKKQTNEEFAVINITSQNPSAKFKINASLLKEICIYIQKKKYPDTRVSSNVTLSHIRYAVLEQNVQEINPLKIQYVINQLSTLEAIYDKTPLMNLNFDITSEKQNEQIQKLSLAIQKLKNDVAKEIVQNQIEKSLRQYNNTIEYIIPFYGNPDNNDEKAKKQMDNYIRYKYSSIARIIKEGYYINKANAELMDFFNRRLVLADTSSIRYEEKRYTFDENFSYLYYDKFQSAFTPSSNTHIKNQKENRNSKKNVNNSLQMLPQANLWMNMDDNNENDELKHCQKTVETLQEEIRALKEQQKQCVNDKSVKPKLKTENSYYDTKLVDIINNLFEGENKHILFACVRNDKDLGKILGALDTLKLVENLKST